MPSAWVAHVKKYYSDRRKKDPKYKYSSAMKDARASYKKADKSEPKSKGANVEIGEILSVMGHGTGRQ